MSLVSPAGQNGTRSNRRISLENKNLTGCVRPGKIRPRGCVRGVAGRIRYTDPGADRPPGRATRPVRLEPQDQAHGPDEEVLAAVLERARAARAVVVPH